MPRKDATGPFGRQKYDLAPENQSSVSLEGRMSGAGQGRGMRRCDGTGRGGGRGMGRGAGRCLNSGVSDAPTDQTPVRNPETGTYGGGRGLHQHRNICKNIKDTKHTNNE